MQREMICKTNTMAQSKLKMLHQLSNLSFELDNLIIIINAMCLQIVFSITTKILDKTNGHSPRLLYDDVCKKNMQLLLNFIGIESFKTFFNFADRESSPFAYVKPLDILSTSVCVLMKQKPPDLPQGLSQKHIH